MRQLLRDYNSTPVSVLCTRASQCGVKVVINSSDDTNDRIVADGFLCVDDRTIYQMIDFALETRP